VLYPQSIIADFCYSPTDNVLSVFVSDSAAEILPYYFECAGANPLDDELNNIFAAFDSLNRVILRFGFPLFPNCNLANQV
jgi:ethanolamine ammonia-lyase large subunit